MLFVLLGEVAVSLAERVAAESILGDDIASHGVLCLDGFVMLASGIFAMARRGSRHRGRGGEDENARHC